jgi:hypothetical protein
VVREIAVFNAKFSRKQSEADVDVLATADRTA